MRDDGWFSLVKRCSHLTDTRQINCSDRGAKKRTGLRDTCNLFFFFFFFFFSFLFLVFSCCFPSRHLGASLTLVVYLPSLCLGLCLCLPPRILMNESHQAKVDETAQRLKPPMTNSEFI